MKNANKLYNILFPLALFLSLKDYPDRKAFCKQNTWKICLAGFGADIIGALLLFLFMILETVFPEDSAIAEAL